MNCSTILNKTTQQWLEANNYSLPDDPNDYPPQVIVPFYQATIWETKANYVATGPVITFPHADFGAFWQKLVLTKDKKTMIPKSGKFFPKNKKQAKKLTEMMEYSLSKASTYIQICIQACDPDERSTYKIAEILKDAMHFLNDLFELQDQVLYLVDHPLQKTSDQ